MEVFRRSCEGQMKKWNFQIKAKVLKFRPGREKIKTFGNVKKDLLPPSLKDWSEATLHIFIRVK